MTMEPHTPTPPPPPSPSTPPTEPPSRAEPSWSEVLTYPLACAGAILGAGIGAAIVHIAASANFYAIVVVGILTGFGAVLLSRRGGWGIAVIAALIALCGGVWAEWWTFPFNADPSLGYFLQHLGDLRPFQLLMHAIGVVAAFWIGLRK